MNSNYLKSTPFLLKNHQELNEEWIQKLIADDPSILGLGDLVLRERERRQPPGGRLDLLLQDIEGERRYEVEIQLGRTDESHIIRTIEYWDIERKRYPQYEHCAVIVAEDITSRFLNVISLFNGTLPLIAIQMQALKIGEHITMVFTTVMGELVRGPVDEDEESKAEPADRAHWEQRAEKTVTLVDELFNLLCQIDPDLNLNYTKFYIGLEKEGRAYNFVKFKPQKARPNFEIKLQRDNQIDQKIEESGLDSLDYKNEHYRLRLTKDDVEAQQELLKEFSRFAYDQRTRTS